MTKTEIAAKLDELGDNIKASAVVLTDAPDDFSASWRHALNLFDDVEDIVAAAGLNIKREDG